MNIDNLLNLNLSLQAILSNGGRVGGKVVEVLDGDRFIFAPQESFETKEGMLLRLSDGQDSVIAKVEEVTPQGLRMCVECYASPGDERRQDVRVYDKIYLKTKFLCHADKKVETFQEARERILSNKLIIDSFVRGKFGPPGVEEMPFTRESLFNNPIIWEINRKLDLLIHMYLGDDFMEIMRTPQKDVNLSASGIRFITKESFEPGDLLEVSMILPMAPLLYIQLMGDVLRMKPVTSAETSRYAVAVRFLQVDSDTKEDIIRYLFKRQREVLRKRQGLED
jgi:hypothetical protein